MIEALFNLLAVAGLVAGVVLVFIGYSRCKESTLSQRFKIASGVFVSGLIVACRGNVFFAGWLPLFPSGIMMLFTEDAKAEPSFEWIIGIWLLYGVFSGVFIGVSAVKLRHFSWTAFCILLMLNIGGCQSLVSSISSIP